MRRFPLGVLVLTIAVACGKTAPPKADSPAKAAEGNAITLQNVSARSAAGAKDATIAAGPVVAQPPNVKIVDYEQLKTFLPEVAGWTADTARGEELTIPAPYSRAEGRYRRDDGRIELEIIDTALNPLLLAPISMFVTAGYSERSDDGFRRATRLGGQPGAEEWNTKSNRGEVTAIAGNRFVVHATGHHLGGIEPVREVVEAVNLARLSALR